MDMNFGDDNGDLLMHMDMRTNYYDWSKVTVMDWRVSGSYSPAANYLHDPTPVFPFQAGVPFNLVVTATGLFTLTVSSLNTG